MTRKRFLTLTLTVGLALALSAPSNSEIQGDFPEVVLFAKDGMTVEASATVVTGDVVVNAANGTLSFGNKAKTPAGWEVKANSIDVGNNVTLAGSEQCNAGELFPCDGGTLDVPVYTLLPVFRTASPAGADIDVPNSASATLDGDALDITLGLEGTLNVTPGVHNVRSITGDKKADLVFTGPTELRIEQNLTMGVEANINLSGPAADQVVIYVGGSAALGPKSDVNANFWVPEGTLELPGNIIATGAFLARDLVVGSKASITLDSYFINRPPVPMDDSATTNEDTPVVVPVLANDTDPNNDLLTVQQNVADPANGTATTDGINVTYTPDADSFADDTFNYQVCDNSTAINGDNCATAAISITVISVNDPPVPTDDTATTDEDTPVVVSVLANDNAGPGNELQNLDVGVITNGANGAVSTDGTTVTYTPNADYFGPDSFTYTACDDGDGADDPTSLCDIATVTLTVVSVNDPPVAADDTATTDEDTPTNVDVLGNDSAGPANEAPALIVNSVTNGANGGVVSNNGSDVTYDPNGQFEALDSGETASDTFTYEACDTGDGADDPTPQCDSATVSVTVNGVNDPPVVADQSLTTDTQTVLVIDLSGTDVESDPLTFSLVSGFTNPAIGVLTNFQQQPPTQARVTFLPSGDGSTGSGSFVYQACDDGGLCDQATVTVTVAAFHAPPTAVGQSIDSTDASVAITLSGSDPEGTNLAFSLVSGPNAGGLTGLPASGASPASIPVTYTPSNPGGADGFVFQVCDSGMPVKCDTAIVTINTTEPPNRPPLPAAPVVNTDGGDPVNVPLSATDPNAGDNLTFTVLTPPDCPDGPGPCAGSVGLVVSTGQTSAVVTYTPTSANDDPDRFVIEVCDDGSPVLCSTAIAKVNGGVESPNDPPTPRPDTIRVSPSGTATTLIDGTTSLLANDNDPNAGQTVSLDVANSPVSGPAEGTVSLFANGTFSYTNTNSAATADQFVYQVCDDGSPVECATATVFVQIIPDQIDVTVSTVFLGDSSGSVVSQPPGIDCGNTCTFTFDTTQPIGLLAIPAGNSVFAGWSGDQDCLDGSLTPNRDKNCVATFDDPFVPDGQPVTIDVVLVGNGAVVSEPAGITCINPNADCSEIYAFGTRVVLRPRAAPGWRFAGYTGSGPGGPQCLNGILDGTLSATCTATFEEVVAPTSLSITVLGTGAGSVTSRPAGISCSGSCSADFADGTVVELYARPDNPATSVFDGWGGDCAGEVGVAIEVTVSGATSCTATFNAAGQ